MDKQEALSFITELLNYLDETEASLLGLSGAKQKRQLIRPNGPRHQRQAVPPGMSFNPTQSKWRGNESDTAAFDDPQPSTTPLDATASTLEHAPAPESAAASTSTKGQSQQQQQSAPGKSPRREIPLIKHPPSTSPMKVGEMTWKPKDHNWEGNEGELLPFQPRKPALIKPMGTQSPVHTGAFTTTRTTATTTAPSTAATTAGAAEAAATATTKSSSAGPSPLIVNGMMFNRDKQKWERLGEDGKVEKTALDDIDDVPVEAEVQGLDRAFMLNPTQMYLMRRAGERHAQQSRGWVSKSDMTTNRDWHLNTIRRLGMEKIVRDLNSTPTSSLPPNLSPELTAYIQKQQQKQPPPQASQSPPPPQQQQQPQPKRLPEPQMPPQPLPQPPPQPMETDDMHFEELPQTLTVKKQVAVAETEADPFDDFEDIASTPPPSTTPPTVGPAPMDVDAARQSFVALARFNDGPDDLGDLGTDSEGEHKATPVTVPKKEVMAPKPPEPNVDAITGLVIPEGVHRLVVHKKKDSAASAPVSLVAVDDIMNDVDIPDGFNFAVMTDASGMKIRTEDVLKKQKESQRKDMGNLADHSQ